jgi:hypothetical protein
VPTGNHRFAAGRVLLDHRMHLRVMMTNLATPQLAAAIDWKLIAAIPGGVLTSIGVITLVVGAIRPLKITSASYLLVDHTTQFSCMVRNKSFFYDRQVRLSIITYPVFWERVKHPRWRAKAIAEPYAPFLDTTDSSTRSFPIKLTKREECTIEGGIRKGATEGSFELGERIRIQAHAGKRRSRPHRLHMMVGAAQITPTDPTA